MLLACKQGQIARRGGCGSIAQLTTALFPETNPVPIKYALSLFSLASPRVRLPLVELGTQSKAELANVLARLCDEYSESMIGKIGGSVRADRRVGGEIGAKFLTDFPR
jgi:dihydrodipicolinate synthase/N-acetylneuraminate lyase